MAFLLWKMDQGYLSLLQTTTHRYQFCSLNSVIRINLYFVAIDNTNILGMSLVTDQNVGD
jgi:hypothetical protein